MILQTKEQLEYNVALSDRFKIAPVTEEAADILLKEIEDAWTLLKIPGTFMEFVASTTRTTLQSFLETRSLPMTDAIAGGVQFATLLGFKLGVEAALTTGI